jgi:hypothetical protein
VTLPQRVNHPENGHTKDDEAGHHDEVFDFFRRAIFGNEKAFQAVQKIHHSTS